MKVAAERLESQLARDLAPGYLIAGDEPLLVGEAADRVRAAARAQGFDERLRYTLEPGFDWQALAADARTGSLFAARRLLELHMPAPKPGDDGARILAAWLAEPPPDTLLLVTTTRLPPEARSPRWVKAFAEHGVVVPVWPIPAEALPGWIEKRLRAAGLTPEAGAARALADRVEGNLLAAAQEVEKLGVLAGSEPLTAAAVETLVADSARFDVFALPAAALEGDPARVARVLAGLEREGAPPALALWALVQELDAGAQAAAAPRPDKAVADLRLPALRRNRLTQALKRLPRPVWPSLRRRAAEAELVVKGQRPGRPWLALLELALAMAAPGTVMTPESAGLAGNERYE